MTTEDLDGKVWQAMSQCTALKLLADDFSPEHPPTVADLLPSGWGYRPDSLQKTERHAAATAVAHRLGGILLNGQGSNARFTFAANNSRYNGLIAFETDLTVTFKAARQIGFVRYPTLFPYAKARYHELHDPNLTPEAQDEARALFRGDYPSQISAFVFRMATAVSRVYTPEETKDASHEALVLLERFASQNTGDFMQMKRELVVPFESMKLIKTTHGHRLRPSNGTTINRTFGVLSHTEYGPTLRCPAHQRLYPDRQTFLQDVLHAGVNLAYDRGVFGVPRVTPVPTPILPPEHP